jgi:hypothetical protein
MKTLLVALLLLVIGTGPAFAACAWVLWTHGLAVVGAALSEGWYPTQAFERLADCERELQAAKERARNMMEQVAKHNRGTLLITAVCLPDTINPMTSGSPSSR